MTLLLSKAIAQLPPPGAVVLLGGGIREQAPEYGGRDQLSHYSMIRTIYAADLAEQTGLDIYTTGGAVPSETSEPEGVLMQRMLWRPASRIHSESAAANAWENAANLRRMQQPASIDRILLVAHPGICRARCAYLRSRVLMSWPRRAIMSLNAEAYDLRSWLPRWNVLADSADGLNEYLGILWYRVHYRVRQTGQSAPAAL